MRATESAWRAVVMALLCGAAAAAPAEPEPGALSLSADGQEVRNAQAGLAWARCLEGQRWTGRHCLGSPRLLDHAQALGSARARRNAEGLDWRLPRARELQRLAHQLGHQAAPQAAPKPALFPGAEDLSWLWSSSSAVDDTRVNNYDYGNVKRGVTNDNLARVNFLHGLAVDMRNGQSDGQVTKRTPLPVRLVRTLPLP